MDAGERQKLLDQEHLRLLTLFHYISGGMTVGFSLLMILWALMMGVMFAVLGPQLQEDAAPGPPGPNGHPMPMVPFVIFGILGVFLVGYGVLEILAGRFIAKRKRRLFTFIVALPRLAMLPYGVILSVFTLIVLDRPSVKQLYREQSEL